MKHHAHASRRGFSLVEMLVVISIMVILAILVLSQNRSGRAGLEVTNLAYGLALFIREAQSYGIAVRQEDVGVNQFDLAYGVYFDETTLNRVVLFKDLNKNGLYASPDTMLKELTFGNVYAISRFCGITAVGAEVCSTGTDVNTLALTFVRPNPDAQIKGLPTSTTYSGAKIYLRAPSGLERVVTVLATGQISVTAP